MKIRIYKLELLGTPLGSIFYHWRRILERKKKRNRCCIYSFKLLSPSYDRIVQHTEMHTHTEFSDLLSSRSIVKPRIVRYVWFALYSVSGISGCLEEGREWEKKRYLLSATKFSCFQRIFLFRLYNPTSEPNVSWRLPVRMRIFRRRVNFFSR